MKQLKNNNGKSIEDVLKQSNIEITSMWAKLASLISTYEGLEWNEAGIKARNLLEDKKNAISYVEEVRAVFNPQQLPREKRKSKSNKKNIVQKKKLRREREFVNYRRLLKIAPTLEQELLSGRALYGKSEVTGFMDFSMELLNQNKRGYYISIAHYFKQNGDLVPDPDMVIRVSADHQFVEALTFQDYRSYKEVYDNYLEPKAVKPKEKQAQNAFLAMWLRNLIKQGHVIEFEEEEEEEEEEEQETTIASAPELEKAEVKEETSKELDLSFMDEKVVSEIKLATENLNNEQSIRTVLGLNNESLKMRPIAHYYFSEYINKTSLGIVMSYPTQKELENDYERLVAEQKEGIEANKAPAKPDHNASENEADVAETVKYWTKLASVIQNVEGLEYEKAKEKALKLRESGKAEDYVVRAFNRKSASGTNQSYKLNYQQLLRLIPSLSKGSIKEKSGIIQRKRDEDVLSLKYEGMEPINKTVQTLSIQKVKKNEIQIIAINRAAKKIWLLSRNGEFYGKSDYDHNSANSEEKQNANQDLGNWLKVMLHYGFEQSESEPETKESEAENPVERLLKDYPIVIEWSEGSAEKNVGLLSIKELQKKLESFEYPKKLNEGYSKTKVWFIGYPHYVRIDLSITKGDYNPSKKNLRKWLDELDPSFDWGQFDNSEKENQDDAKSKEIPDFEVGKVKLVEAHIKAGLDQEDIDFINKNKRGLTITPLSDMTNKTKNFEADLAKQALKPGFRISKTGKLYYEDRSNRSDLTDGGL